MKATCFWWSLPTGTKIKVLTRSIAAYQRCVDLVQQQNHIWKSNYNWCHHLLNLWQSNIILVESQLLHLVSPSEYYQSLQFLQEFLQAMQYCFWFTVFAGKDSSSGFHLVFPTTLALIPCVIEPLWRPCQLLSISILIIRSETGKITTRWTQLGPLWDGYEPCINNILLHNKLFQNLEAENNKCDLKHYLWGRYLGAA